MEHTNQKGANKFVILDGHKTDFGTIWGNFVYLINHALDIFKKDPVTFIIAALLPLLVSWALLIIVLPILATAAASMYGILAIVVSVLMFVLTVVSYLAVLKATVDKAKGNNVNVGELFGFALKNFVNYIILGIKVLLTIFGGLTKFVNSWLSTVYFVENNGKVDEAVKSSQATSEKKTATVAWGMIVSSVVVSIAGSILSSIWLAVLGGVPYVGSIGSYAITGLITVFTLLCSVVLKNELEKGHSA
ncbi:MAG: hypothetical protein ACRCZE_04650 [Candidatus Altimarinota bacterium]